MKKSESKNLNKNQKIQQKNKEKQEKSGIEKKKVLNLTTNLARFYKLCL